MIPRPAAATPRTGARCRPRCTGCRPPTPCQRKFGSITSPLRAPARNPASFVHDPNPDSLEVLTDCRLEPALAAANSDDPVQFERQGYFCRDPDSAPGRLVFNRTVGLRDTWARVSGGKGAPS